MKLSLMTHTHTHTHTKILLTILTLSAQVLPILLDSVSKNNRKKLDQTT